MAYIGNDKNLILYEKQKYVVNTMLHVRSGVGKEKRNSIKAYVLVGNAYVFLGRDVTRL
jgi:hypothetical protein